MELLINKLFGKSRNEFVEGYLEKEMLFSKKTETLKLPTVHDFPKILTRAIERPDLVCLINKGSSIDVPKKPNGTLDIQKVWEYYYGGASIILNSIYLFDDRIKDLCNQLQYELGHRLQTNAYFTPANAQAFSTHYDVHDVVVLQLHGEKEWKFYDRPESVPSYPVQRMDLVDIDSKLKQITSIYMKQGSALYLPRGIPHQANTRNFQSLHITFGLVPISRYDALNALIDIMNQNEESLRENFSANLFKNSIEDEAILPSFGIKGELQKFNKYKKQAIMALRKKESFYTDDLYNPLIVDTYSPEQTILRWRQSKYVKIGNDKSNGCFVFNGVRGTNVTSDEYNALIYLKKSKELNLLDFTLMMEGGIEENLIERLCSLGIIEVHYYSEVK